VGDEANLSIELAQFTQSKRRTALALLNLVRKALIQSATSQFAHLRNRLVMLGFDDPRGLPPRMSDQEAIDVILRMLERTAPGPGPKTGPETLNSDGFAVELVNSVLGQGTAACFPLPVLPQSPLAAQHGFEIAAALTIVVRARDTEAELARLVSEHDSAKSDILLISAGAPGRSDGLALVGDEIAVEPWIMKTIAMPQPKGGGPLIVPVGRALDWIWTSPCPCGTKTLFAECHGRLDGT
jgi:hypothetical protein